MPFKETPKIKLRRVLERERARREPYPRPCTKCSKPEDRSTWKMSDEFGSHSVASDGLRPDCRRCEHAVCMKRPGYKPKWLKLQERAEKYRKEKWAALKDRPAALRATMLTLAQVRAFFRINGEPLYQKTLDYWIKQGPFWPLDLKFPQCWGKKRRYKRTDLEAFVAELIRREDELRVRLNPKRWSLEAWKYDAKLKIAERARKKGCTSSRSGSSVKR